MSITAEALRRINTDIWTTALGLPLDDVSGAAFERHALVYTGQVQITGAWTGTVLVELTEPLAQLVAATMFGLEPGELAEDDVADTVGELGNMTGGNVKALMPGVCSLSLPSVTVGTRYRVAVPGSKVRERLTHTCEGELLAVTILEGAAG